MKNTRKIIFLVAALLCVMLLFVACKKDKQPEEGADVPVVLIKDGECVFAVVGDESQAYMKSFLQNVNKSVGVTPTVYKTAEEVPEGMAAIFVGTPQQFATDEMIPTVPYFGYLIEARGGALYVLGYDNSVLGEATGYLRLRFEEFMNEGTLEFAADYAYTREVSSAYGAGAAPYLEGGKNARIFDCDTGYQMVLLEDVDKAEFDAYITKLAGEGYTLHSENDMNGNIFKTYQKGGVMLHTYWVEYSKEVRTIVAKTNNLPVTSNSGNNNLCEPLIHQLKVLVKVEGKTWYDGGLGMVIRLADGRFIVVDGGSNATDANEIYEYLKYAAVDKNNIVIAAWYFTHGHGDHVDGFVEFAKNYSKNSTIKIESFMYNQCYTPAQTEFLNPTSDIAVKTAMATYYPTVPVYKPLTGQKYTFSTTTIEILYTMPDFMPNVIGQEPDYATKGEKNGDGNTQTMLAIFDIVNNADKDDRIFMGGDGTKPEFDEVVKRYKSYIQCDMIQVPHHGHASDDKNPAASARRHNGTKELYQYVNPKYAFWSTSQNRYTDRMNNSVNQYLDLIIKKNGGKHYIADTVTNTTNTIVFK